MDAVHGTERAASDEKNHFQEAIVLASKVVSAPRIIAEICMSDDPDYVTGYVAAPSIGYQRTTRLKEPGGPDGGHTQANSRMPGAAYISYLNLHFGHLISIFRHYFCG